MSEPTDSGTDAGTDAVLRALLAPAAPVDPDPAFAAALRSRVEAALLAPDDEPTRPTTREEPVSAPTTEPATEATARALPLHTVTPYLCVLDSRAAVEFCVAVFGAARRGEPIVMPDGRVGHVEVAVGDSVLMMADEFPELGLLAPATRGGVGQSLRVEAADPDAVVARAVAAGGTVERPVTDSPYGRTGVVVDPSGHRWMVSRSPAAPRPGEIVYASLWAPDTGRAAAFYAAVLGWETVPSPSGSRQVVNAGRRLGMYGEPARTTMACYAVADLDAAVALVRAAGGTATDPSDEPHGRVADCVDDQGLAFALWQAGPDAGAPGEAAPGVARFTHLALQVPDAIRARAFYGTVLGWGFVPGAFPDSWSVRVGGARTSPGTAVRGGHREAAGVPTFAVADLDATLAAVRRAGGTAGEPLDRPYGRSADCVDDQGARFQLVER